MLYDISIFLKMRVILILVCCSCSAFAFLIPERCEKLSTSHRTIQPSFARSINIDTVVSDISDLAVKQEAQLKKIYKNYQYHGVPNQMYRVTTPSESSLKMFGPQNCSIVVRYKLLDSIISLGSGSKIQQTPSEVGAYASNGFNWYASLSPVSSFSNLFEIGGKVSDNSTYYCKLETHNSSQRECLNSGKSGTLELYVLQSDLQCDFGNITVDIDEGRASTSVSKSTHFKQEELVQITNSKLDISYTELIQHFDNYPYYKDMSIILIDLNKIPINLLLKIMKTFPRFNPYTDAIGTNYSKYEVFVIFLKNTAFEKEYTRIIPYTNANGDSDFQAVCLLTPF